MVDLDLVIPIVINCRLSPGIAVPGPQCTPICNEQLGCTISIDIHPDRLRHSNLIVRRAARLLKVVVPI